MLFSLCSILLAVSHAINVRPPQQHKLENTVENKCKFFTLWEYPHNIPEFAQLNVESWHRHSNNRCETVMINDTNIMEYIPDMPTEYFQLPYTAAKSDMIRYALVYHHGGIYLDSDFLVADDISDIIDKLDTHDLVSYESEGQHCEHGDFSSNFLGGRKGSEIIRNMWEKQKEVVRAHCPEQERELEKVCCFDDHSVCHIPWTQLGEGISHPVMREFVEKDVEQKHKYHCYGGPDSFVPKRFNNMLDHTPRMEQAKNNGMEPNFLQRKAYHLFNSNSGISTMSHDELFDKSTVIGALYSTAFGRM